MTPRTPIEAWPTVRHTGRAGYSARHFAAVSPAADDPLRVAERIAARADAESVSAQAHARLANGDKMAEILDWQSWELSALGRSRWERLCSSFNEVIATLESAKPMTPGIQRLIRDAKRAEKAAR